MTCAPAWLDYALVAGYLLVLISMGWYFRRVPRSHRDFLFAGRSLSGFPLGLSLAATCLAAGSYTGLPADAYYAGCQLLAVPLAIWCCLPGLTRVVLPLYYRLGISSVYEYLELRYDARVRRLGSALFVLWRLLWVGLVLYLPGRVLVEQAGLHLDLYWLLVTVGLITTLYTCQSGMQGIVWTTAVQAVVMAVGLVLIIVTIWMQLDGGPERVVDVARALGRLRARDGSPSADSIWTSWGSAPHILAVLLCGFVSDQLTVQRCLAARNLAEARWSVAWTCVFVTCLVAGQLCAGLGLLAFYHDHPQALRPIWVANVDHQTQRSVCDLQGNPLLAWHPQAITPENIDRLVAAGRLLRPNTREPFTRADDLIVSDAGGIQVDVRELSMRRPPPDDRLQGEVILHTQARAELLPHFIASQLAHGLRGCVWAALLAASMCSVSAGIHSICTLLVVEARPRPGRGRRGWPWRWSAAVDQGSAREALRTVRRLVLIVGIAATVVACGMAWLDATWATAVTVLSILAGPLLAVFLLGLFTRRATATSACTTLLAGMVVASCLAAVNAGQAGVGQHTWHQQLSGLWPFACGTAFSLAWGYASSFVLGQRKAGAELRGLVVGLGPLGVREPDEASIAIPDSFDGADPETAP
mgnify:CR=1 FL=1